MGAEGYLVSPTVFKTDGGGGPAPVSSILTCPRHTQKRPSPLMDANEEVSKTC